MQHPLGVVGHRWTWRLVVLALLAAPRAAPLGAQSPTCSCATGDDDRGRPWLWLLGALAGGTLAAWRPHTPTWVETGLPERAPTLLATTDAGAAPAAVVPLVPLSPGARVVTASSAGLVCTPTAAAPRAPRSRRAIEREKAWWQSLTPAQRARVDRANARRREHERRQRRTLCVVLFPAAVPAAGYLAKAAWAASAAGAG